MKGAGKSEDCKGVVREREKDVHTAENQKMSKRSSTRVSIVFSS